MPIRFQVDDDFYDHPKTLDMSDAAVALWTRAGSYSAAKLLDGFVPEGMLARLSRRPTEASGELVARGLWKRVKGGFRFHQWDQRNLTRARVETDRENWRDNKRRQRNGQVNGHIVPGGQPRDGPGTPQGVPPLSMSVSESVSVSVSGQRKPPSAAPPRNCPKHPKGTTDDCGACMRARQAAEQWQADKRARVAAGAKCRVHAGQLAANCALCRAEELSPA